jgi:O-6-methylguanine DNA methyltransferase
MHMKAHGDQRDPAVAAVTALIQQVLPEPEPPRPEHRAALWQQLAAAHTASRATGAAAHAQGGAGPIRYTVVDGHFLGAIYVAYTERGICYLTSAAGDEAEFVDQVRRRYGRAVSRDDTGRDRWQRALDRWFSGGRPEVNLDLSWLTAFERAVLERALTIPRGAVRPYQWLAEQVGKPGASRAVGNAMARNPIPLFIPCHRVVAASGTIGNYSMGGPAVKRRLLEWEGVDVNRLEALARQGYRFKGSRTTRIYCYPTCRPISREHEVLFHSAAEAEAAGYRPCKLCQPHRHAAGAEPAYT